MNFDKGCVVSQVGRDDYKDVSIMVGELLNEIMLKIDRDVFNYDQSETEERISQLVKQGKYWVFIAKDIATNENIGFVSLYESYALYAEGAYGTMPELFVRKDYRSHEVGKLLLESVTDFAQQKQWNRIEVTTPPLPQFGRTLQFYENNGFEVSGGRKLKIDIKR